MPGVTRFARLPTYRENAAVIEHLLPIDPSCFGDPRAETVAWEPTDAEGGNFRTFRLVRVSPTRYELRMTRQLIFLLWLMLTAGLASFAFMIASIVDRPDELQIAWLIMPAVTCVAGIVFTGLAGLMLYKGRRTVAFDKQSCRFWDDRYRRLIPRFGTELRQEVGLDRVSALQVLALKQTGVDEPYYCFELNLVLDSAERIPVTCHGSLRHLREEAAELARFLDVPLWDATKQQINQPLAKYLGV